MTSAGFFPHGYCLQWDTPLIVTYVVTDALVALSYYSIPAALFFLVFKRRQSLSVQPLLILFGLFIAFCGAGHAIDIVSLWKPVYWLKGIWNVGTAGTSVLTAFVLIPRVMDFVRMPETTARLQREKSELEERQTLIQAVLDSTAEGIVLEGEQGHTLLYNAAAQRILSNPRRQADHSSQTGDPAQPEAAPRVNWKNHRTTDRDVLRLPNGLLVERFTRAVEGYGQLYVLRDMTASHESDEQRHRLERIIETMKQGFAIARGDTGAILSTNPAFQQMYGRGREELLGREFGGLLEGTGEERRMAFTAIADHTLAEGYWEGETHNVRRDGETFIADTRINVHQSGEQKLFSVIQTDITDQKKLEQESRRLEQKMIQTAKLESVGVLAGGIAHDFNNLLTGILGNASLVFDQLSPSSALRASMRDVMQASERAADLTRQLLAYSGKGRFVIEVVDVNAVVHEVNTLVRMSIPRHVDVELKFGDRPLQVEADAVQVQQLVMNLIINAAEAVPEDRRGRVMVTAFEEDLDAHGIETLVSDCLSPGRYAVVEVQDNGSGMDRATMAQIFDPFFTTKFTGRGLGLAAAIGIVRGHRGDIKVYSEIGQGSTFRVYLPVAESAVAAAPAAAEEKRARPARGMGTVLVVDDEEPVRNAVTNTLAFYGYRVLAAENGKRGVELFEQFADEITVVLLDLTMPVMNGEEALEKIRRVRPGAAVVLSSGFNEAEALRKFSGKNLAGFLQKPYTAAKLVDKIHAAAEL